MSNTRNLAARPASDHEMRAAGAAARLQSYIDKRRLDARILRLPAPMPTVAAAAQQMQVPPASIAKTLVFVVVDDGVIIVAVAPGDRRVLPQQLAASVGNKELLRMASRDDVLRIGYSPGAVAPLAFLHAVQVVVDSSLLAYERVLAGAGEYELLLDVAVSDIVACNRAVVAPIT